MLVCIQIRSRLNYGTAPCPATNLSILICKSFARTKQSVISVALKTPLEITLGICIYKTSLLHRPDDYIGFPRSCPLHILQQNCAHELAHNRSGLFGVKWVFLVSMSCLKAFRSTFKAMSFQGLHWLQKLGSCKASFGVKVV